VSCSDLCKEASILRLILRHPYMFEAVDVSGQNNHGLARDVDFIPDGIAPRSGAAVFDKASSRVAVVNRRDFDRISALKIDITLRLRSSGTQRTLLDGDGSFTFFIHPAGFPVGGVLASSAPGATPAWQYADTHLNSPDGTVRMVPIGQWCKLTYLHDGFETLRLYLNDGLAAIKTGFHSPVPPAGPLGVHVGNKAGVDADVFDGEIDEVGVSRWDPDAAYTQFFSRTPGNCWQPIFSQLAKRASGPDGRQAVAAIVNCVGSLQVDLIRAVRSAGDAAIRRNDEYARRYRELWRTKPIDGPDMQALLTDWFGWLQGLLGSARIPQTLHGIANCVGTDAIERLRSRRNKAD
jgi:hypothetical protein